jgi:hypothetical protein
MNPEFQIDAPRLYCEWSEYCDSPLMAAKQIERATVESWRTPGRDSVGYSELEVVPQRELRNSLVTPITGGLYLTKLAGYQSNGTSIAITSKVKVSPIEQVE